MSKITLQDLQESMQQTMQVLGMPLPPYPPPMVTQQLNALPVRIVVTEGMSGMAILRGEAVLFVPPSAVTNLKEV